MTTASHALGAGVPWPGEIPLANEHVVDRWRSRVSPELTLDQAHVELRDFILRATATTVPPPWVDRYPDTAYYCNGEEPEICVPVRLGHMLTVLVRTLAPDIWRSRLVSAHDWAVRRAARGGGTRRRGRPHQRRQGEHD